MRKCSVPRQLLAVVMGGVLVGGCSGLGAKPIDAPSPMDVVDFTHTFEAYTGRRIDTANDYVWAGYAYIDQHCQTFFDALEMGRKDGVFAKETIAAGGAFSTEVMTLLKNSQTAIGIVTGAVTLVTNSVERYNNMYNFAQYSPALWQHVSTAQSKYKSIDMAQTMTDIGPSGIGTAATFYQAHQVVQGYARLCSIPQIEYFVHTALNNSKTVAADLPNPGDKSTTGDGGGSAAEGAPLVHRHHSRKQSVAAPAFRFPVYEAR